MSDFIRGGQVTFHNLRMFIQLARVLFRISLALVLISVVYSYVKNIAPHEWQLGAIWLKKDIYNVTHKVEYQNQYGIKQTIRLGDVKHDPYIGQVINKFKTTLHKGAV